METEFILANDCRTVCTSRSDCSYLVMLMPRLTEAIVTIIRYKANIILMTSCNVFGVLCSENEWKLRNSAMLVVEEPFEEYDALCDSFSRSMITSSIS